MKYLSTVILAIAVITVGLSVAGCLSIPGLTSTSSHGQTSLKSVVDFNKVKWFEYNITSGSAGKPTIMTMKSELSVPYGSISNADHTVIHMDSDTQQGKSVIDIDAYTNPADGKTLGGHVKITMSGMTIIDSNIDQSSSDVNDRIGTYLSQNPVRKAGQSTSTLTYIGKETVTVPAGTFNCNKYTVNDNDLSNLKISLKQSQIWIDPNVPVPIKWAGTQDDQSTIELVGWK